MATLRNHYLTLGVPESATSEEIRRAFRRLAREWHPDRHPGSAEANQRFKEVSEAHWVLIDTTRRLTYDRLRQPPPTSPDERRTAAATLGAFVGTLFNTIAKPRPSSTRTPPARGQDLLVEVRIPFLVAARGGQQALTIKREVICGRCQGEGAEPNTPVATCPTCQGTGAVAFDQDGFSITRPCAVCGGRGTLAQVPCQSCKGAGVRVTEKTVAVRIPACIESGTRLCLVGEGEQAPGGTHGDLLVHVHVDEHPTWKRRGCDIHSDVSLNIVQACLGTTAHVDTLDGSLALAIPAGTQPGTIFKISGRGLVRQTAGGGRGDHVVRVNVKVPAGLSPEARVLLKQLESHLS